MLNLEFKHLQLVQAIVEAGSLTLAARRLGLSQSALSHQLKDLEGRLQTLVFNRAGRGLALAPAGERILAAARNVIPELARLAGDLQNNSASPALIRIATECYTCYHWLPGILRQFETRYPSTNVQIVLEATRKPIEALLENRLDIAIISSRTRDRRVRLMELFEDELVVITAANHCLNEQKYLSAQHFQPEPLFLYTPLTASVLFQQVLRPAGIKPKRVTEVPLTEAIIELVEAGFGIAPLARWAVRPYLGRSNFRVLPITSRGLHRKWYAAVRRASELPAYLVAFIDALRTQLKAMTE
jgi:LysR family transcriptional regulator, regulator for metE and metH